MKRTDITGLCGNCAHVEVCKFARGADRDPVLCCEEYAVKLLPIKRKPIPRPSPEGDKRTPSETGTLNLGLCYDCENRNTCCLKSKPEGGVWHCEEYQ